MYYSKETGGFYAPEIHGGDMPGDRVEITEAIWAQMLEGQSEGRVIRADDSGAPYLADPEPGQVQNDERMFEQRIQNEIRAMAIERLKSKGELKSDFIDEKGA